MATSVVGTILKQTMSSLSFTNALIGLSLTSAPVKCTVISGKPISALPDLKQCLREYSVVVWVIRASGVRNLFLPDGDGFKRQVVVSKRLFIDQRS
ncbi:unnamed protein product [Arabidopsis thaliana]|uniref:(thale cress) hypothetical protein n=1 Tax=Arabidopsis thaliana TaxID=3702 RepID=A0A7G2EGM1_ARATH|nr:unnamed protein product [Arabidopsis thaliana]